MELAEETPRGRWLGEVLPGAPLGVPRLVRFVWLALLVIVAVVQLAGLTYVLFDAYRIDPALHKVGIAIEFDDASLTVVRPLRADIVAAGVSAGDRIAAVGKRRFAADASAFSMARAIMAVPGDTVPIVFRKPDGREVSIRASRSSRAPLAAAPVPIPVNVRLGVRLFFTLLCSLALIGSSLVLLHRRPRDPVALLLGLGFLGIAASVDPPLLMWMSIGAGWVIDAMTGLWWTILVIALAAFPDGRFTPRWLRWSLVVAPLLGLLLAFDPLMEVFSILIGVGVPLALLAAQVVRYRRLEPGHKRQQIKWAALGFSAGFLLVGIAVVMSLQPYDDWPAGPRGAWMLGTICLFNLGFAMMPLGLLISLIRYRLWDVDQIISRSVAYTLLTGGVGLVWALLSDIAKQLVATLLGPDHALLGLGLGAIIAVGVFVPTQQLVLQWSKKRFDPSSIALERLPDRLRIWRERCGEGEVAMRALDVAMRALHPAAGAVFKRTATGHALLASRGVAPDDDAAALAPESAGSRGGHVLALEDEDGLAGWMVLASRDDGTRFARSQLAALNQTSGALATALRVATPGHRREAAVLSVLDEVQQRLAQLEQNSARPA
ncbi:hypothetical protein QH494_13245 [Sphingomonas sp. AR_OL41]|uniref:hypothetical protein n=1 Tax=Sphingomonas sp. AR_OL41 TaxID=3042729 RepID=UPI002480457A|nr:hypothetical protein [Sphingomonas sp. AR_OL41]MDH7973148.1 hypothetical protein [Sphingomonas sp. AR_OL41]